jgi:hypothetical protein
MSPGRNQTSILNEWWPALGGNAPKQKIQDEARSSVRQPTAQLRPSRSSFHRFLTVDPGIARCLWRSCNPGTRVDVE